MSYELTVAPLELGELPAGILITCRPEPLPIVQLMLP
jgi:hypothetical protein